MTPGGFLVVEGPEGAGKSTLVHALADRLRAAGRDAVLVREPGGTPVAERIREVLLDPAQPIEPVSELYLFLAARADLVARVIGPALAAGQTVIADRFQLSTEAYQCGGRGTWVRYCAAKRAKRAITTSLPLIGWLCSDAQAPTRLLYGRLSK